MHSSRYRHLRPGDGIGRVRSVALCPLMVCSVVRRPQAVRSESFVCEAVGVVALLTAADMGNLSIQAWKTWLDFCPACT